MNRRETTIALAALGVLPLAVEAQQGAKVARIGYLSSSSGVNSYTDDAVRQGLRDLGYVEGRNVLIELRDAEGRLERLPALAAELVALKVDVIVAPGTPAALAAKQATSVIPVVFPAAGEPVASGLVTNLARPGGNVNGLAILNPQLIGKRFELLKRSPARSRYCFRRREHPRPRRYQRPPSLRLGLLRSREGHIGTHRSASSPRCQWSVSLHP
jgi:putative ABC transport system substrate-binding protein